jgi:hypothetical protein
MVHRIAKPLIRGSTDQFNGQRSFQLIRLYAHWPALDIFRNPQHTYTNIADQIVFQKKQNPGFSLDT